MLNKGKYISDFNTNVKIELNSLTVDTDPEIPLDIFDYFNIEIPPSLLEDWDSDEQLPFHCEVECILVSNNRTLICPIIVPSAQHFVINSTFPNITILHNVTREQHLFLWETPNIIELPIFYSELPVNTVLKMRFYACLFQAPKEMIGEVKLPLFTSHNHRLRTGPYILTFDDKNLYTNNDNNKKSKSETDINNTFDNPTNQDNNNFDDQNENINQNENNTQDKYEGISLGSNVSSLQKHVRRVATGRSPVFEMYDEQIKVVAESLHPDDAATYFLSLYDPMNPPVLSAASKFVQINLVSPATPPSTYVYYSDLSYSSIFDYISSNISMFQLSKEANNEKIQKTFSQIRAMPPLADISANYKSFIRTHYETCLNDPSLMSALFRSMNWDDKDDVKNLADKLLRLNPIDINFTLEFFAPRFEHESVRQFAVRCVKFAPHDKIISYLPQLIQAINVNFSDGLSEILIEHAKSDIVFATTLYWDAALYCSGNNNNLNNNSIDSGNKDVKENKDNVNDSVNEKGKITLLLENLMNSLDNDSKKELNAQIKLIEDIEKVLLIANPPNSKGKKTQEIRKKVQDLLMGDFSHLQRFDPIRIPLKPSLFTNGIDPNDIRVFVSKLCPVCLTFNLVSISSNSNSDSNINSNADANPNNSNNVCASNEDDTNIIRKYRIIFKIGDDMRQDQLILQIFDIMDKIFHKSSLQLYITTYPILAFTKSFGCCEFIENSKAIFDIVKVDKMSLGQFFGEKEVSEQEYAAKIDRYTKSLAAYSVMTYVLLIGDRHDNNIMVKKDGKLLHIDFGFILGDVTKPFTPPIKLRKGMLDVIGGSSTSDAVNTLISFAGPALNSLRKDARLILTMNELMFNSGIPCFDVNAKRKLQRVEQSLMLGLTEVEAMDSLRSIVNEALNSKAMSIWDTVHGIAISAKS